MAPTRLALPDLKAFWQTTAPEVKLLRLSRDAGVHLLKTLGVTGAAHEFATLVEDTKGHALGLTFLGRALPDVIGCDPWPHRSQLLLRTSSICMHLPGGLNFL